MLRHISSFFNRFIQMMQELTRSEPEPLVQNTPNVEPSSIIPPIPSKVRPKRRMRSTTTYQRNVTAALALPVNNAQLVQLKIDPDLLFAVSEENIKEHALRRIDIYFYLLVALYNTHQPLQQGSTMLQHGKGRTLEHRTITHACHSNFFPTLIHASNDAKENIFANTHFMDTMNATVELPTFVNQLDMILEGKINFPSELRKTGLSILQAVSDGKYDPMEGLEHFLKKAHQVLEALESDNGKQKNYLSRKTGISKQMKLKLLNVVKHGTFFCEKKEDLNTYFQLLLRLKPNEIAECKKNPEVRKKIYLEKMEMIKTEIQEAKSVISRRKVAVAK